MSSEQELGTCKLSIALSKALSDLKKLYYHLISNPEHAARRREAYSTYAPMAEWDLLLDYIANVLITSRMLDPSEHEDNVKKMLEAYRVIFLKNR